MGKIINLPVNSHKDLAVWERSRKLVVSVYAITKQFPKEEIYSLTSQMRRAAVSIPSNIAEGKARRSTKDFTRFITIARGSTAELETQFLISQDLGYLSEEQVQPLLNEIDEIGKMLSGLLSKLESLATST